MYVHISLCLMLFFVFKNTHNIYSGKLFPNTSQLIMLICDSLTGSNKHQIVAKTVIC